MKFPIMFIGLTPTARIRVYIWGQHDEHLMDWRGQNNRVMLAPGCKRDFETVDDALAWARERFKTQAELEAWAAKAGNGQHFGDDHPLQKYLDWEVPLKDKMSFANAIKQLEGTNQFAKELQAIYRDTRRKR